MPNSECRKCGACCRRMVFKFIVYNSHDKEFFTARGFKVDDNLVTADVPHHCPHLTKDNLCDIHDSKPTLCRTYPDYIVDKSVLPVECVWRVTKR